MANVLISGITLIATYYTLFLILYGLNIYWNLYLPTFVYDSLDSVCRPFVSLFKNVRIGRYSLALLASIGIVFFVNLLIVSLIHLIFLTR